MKFCIKTKINLQNYYNTKTLETQKSYKIFEKNENIIWAKAQKATKTPCPRAKARGYSKDGQINYELRKNQLRITNFKLRSFLLYSSHFQLSTFNFQLKIRWMLHFVQHDISPHQPSINP